MAPLFWGVLLVLLLPNCRTASTVFPTSLHSSEAGGMKCDVASPALWTYRVQASPGARQLHVQAEFPPGVPPVMGVDRFAQAYLHDLELCTGEGWEPVVSRGSTWRIARCARRGCAVRYRYDLRTAAERIDRFGYAAIRGQGILSPPTTWLLHPKNYQGGDDYQLEVQVASGDAFVTGVWQVQPVAEGSVPAEAIPAPRYRAKARLLFEAPYSAFGKIRKTTAKLNGAWLNLAIVESAWPLAVSDQQLMEILSHHASWVARYYGKFPVAEVNITVVPRAGSELFGMELGNGGASILLFVGRELSEAQLQDHWVIIHEMLHLGFPSLPRSYRFWAEGMATYQEGLIRARAGLWSERELWAQMVHYLPQGQAVQGDRGLGKTQTWGRTYWGGALLCLLLDIELRSASQGRVSLDDFAREVLAEGGHTGSRWSVSQVVRVLEVVGRGSDAVPLYRRHTEGAVSVDLKSLFASLGVVASPAGIVFEDNAPLAALRRSLVTPRTPIVLPSASKPVVNGPLYRRGAVY